MASTTPRAKKTPKKTKASVTAKAKTTPRAKKTLSTPPASLALSALPLASFTFEPRQFMVEEIGADGAVYQVDQPITHPSTPGKFTHFVLQKERWNTVQGLDALGRALHVNARRFDFAGTKDRQAVTTQLCSAFAIEPDRLRSVHVKDLKILGAWTATDKVRLGSLQGNRFTLTLTAANCGNGTAAPDAEKIRARDKELGGVIPNYFGEQRFGSVRRNTHLVGKLLVQGKAEDAVKNYLAFVDESEPLDARQAREALVADWDWGEALNRFPVRLQYERSLLAHLHAYPNDYVGALRKLPRKLQLMFVHALQSQLFNEMLEERAAYAKLFEAEKGDWFYAAEKSGFPSKQSEEVTSLQQAKKVTALLQKKKAFLAGNLIGYDSHPSPFEEKLLKREGLAPKDFQLKQLPELSSKGARRPLTVPLLGFEILSPDPVRIRFSLPSGAYATVALRALLA